MSSPLLQLGESIPSNFNQDQLNQVFQERMQNQQQPTFFSQLFGQANKNLQQTLPMLGNLAMGQQQDPLAQMLMPFLNMQTGMQSNMQPNMQMLAQLFNRGQ